LVRDTFNEKLIYRHGITPLDVSRRQTLRGTIEQVGSEFVLLTNKIGVDRHFGRTRFRLVFDNAGKFLRGYEMRMTSDEQVGWIEQ